MGSTYGDPSRRCCCCCCCCSAVGGLAGLTATTRNEPQKRGKKKYPNFLGAKGPVILLLTLLVTHVFLLTPSKGPEPFDPEVPEWREDWSPLQSQVLSRFVGPASSEKEGGGKEARVTNFGKGATTGILFTPSGQQRGKKTR